MRYLLLFVYIFFWFWGESGLVADMQNIKILTQAGFFKINFYPKVCILHLNQIYDKNINIAIKAKRGWGWDGDGMGWGGLCFVLLVVITYFKYIKA